MIESLKVNRLKNIYNSKSKNMKLCLQIPSDEVHFKIRFIIRSKEGLFVMIKESIQEEDIIIRKVCAQWQSFRIYLHIPLFPYYSLWIFFKPPTTMSGFCKALPRTLPTLLGRGEGNTLLCLRLDWWLARLTSFFPLENWYLCSKGMFSPSPCLLLL